MRMSNLLVCFIVATIIISLGSTTVFAEDNCTDSDGGKDYYVKGQFSGMWEGTFITNTDSCLDPIDWDNVYSSEYLGEAYCENDILKIEKYTCPNGCSDGACIKEEIPVPCYGVYCRDEYTCIKSAYQVCRLKSKVDQCSEIDGPVYENCYVYNYYQAPMIEYLTDYNGNRFMISELSGEDVKIKAIDPDTNAVLEYWISTTERKAVLSGKNTMIITIDSIFYDLNPPSGSKDRVSLRVETPSVIPIEEESVISEQEEEIPITQPIIGEAVCENGPCIYGIYATLGEMFKLQETQPVKIVDYLDSNNNPLKITFANVQKPNNAITLRLDFNNENIYMEPTVGESMEFFGANIKFVSIDDSWKYATIEVTADQISAGKAGARIAAQATTEIVSTLETVKTKASEQTAGIATAQEKILEVNIETDTFEQELDERGIGYKFRWFFGMVAEQEKQDAEFLKSQGQRLIETADLLLTISEQVEEPAKTVLVEQAESLKEQAQEISEKAADKEKSAKGMFSWFG